MKRSPGHCRACRALTEECGDLFPLYSRKLLVRTWPGSLSATERAYIKAHRSEVLKAQAAAASRRAATVLRRATHRNGPMVDTAPSEKTS